MQGKSIYYKEGDYMILEREQINRYLRHIIIPEISGPGQKVLLESKVFVFADTAINASPLLYYLAAAGVGKIYCSFVNTDGYLELFCNLRDLNNDILIESVDSGSADCLNPEIRIVLGTPQFIENYEMSTVFCPTIIGVISNWRGLVKTFDNQNDKISFFSSFKNQASKVIQKDIETLSSIFSAGLVGTIAAIEGIKLRLNLGRNLKKLLYFDLLDMKFQKVDDEKQCTFIEKLLYDNTPDGLTSRISKVLIVGTGGLGSPIAYALASAGVDMIGLVDFDSVEISNLNRQILHSTSRIGLPKVESAKIFLKKLNPDVEIVTYNTDFDKETALDIISGYDVVVDGVDNLPTRYLLNDACFLAEKPMVEGGVLRFDGLAMTIVPKKSSCYRCIFPEMPSGNGQHCSEYGVLGPVPGAIGFIQAAEAYKVLHGIGQPLMNRLLFFEGLDMDFNIVQVDKNNNCPICGSTPSITSLQDYNITCIDNQI